HSERQWTFLGHFDGAAATSTTRKAFSYRSGRHHTHDYGPTTGRNSRTWISRVFGVVLNVYDPNPAHTHRGAAWLGSYPSQLLSGGDLLSHNLPVAVPSALWVLASGFGMGPGVSPTL